jgi:M6 family metalloprotease-like protein
MNVRGGGRLKQRSIITAVLSGIVICGVLAAARPALSGKVLRVRRPSEETRPRDLIAARISKWRDMPVRDMPSRRRLLGARPRVGPLAAPSDVPADILRIAALRIEFASVPDPALITGNGGRFDLSDRRNEVLIDPPPHDRKYFMRHMESLANYYSAMSYGHLEIQWEVFPLANDEAYVLPDIGDYNPGGGVYTWELEGLELFFRDAIKVADLDEDLDYRDFDAVVLFHAGSDWQNDIYSDSPYDIPSFFISLAGSIAVEDSTHFIVDGSVVPETTTQDGYFNGINGVLAHEVGHQLGLPDLYDTRTGLSVVGYWDLMDYGSGVGVVLQDTLTDEYYYVTGIVAGSLSAWSKAQLGWVVPDTIDYEGSRTIRATELQEGFPNTEAVVVPINSYEYYLIENRQADLDGDGLGFLLTDPSEDSTGVIMGPVDSLRQFNYEYDFALPGDGLLIWHVDRVWSDFLNPYDLVNAYADRRGVTLKEADGIPDLGDWNSFYYLGGPDDPFRRGNNDRLADDTYPSSRSNTGCHSHVVIDGISDSGVSMSFRVSHDWGTSGFPFALGDSLRFGVSSLLVVDTDRDGRDEITSALKRAVWDDSLGVVWRRSEIHTYGLDEDGRVVPAGGWPRRLYGLHPTEIASADFEGTGDLITVVADEIGHIYGFTSDGNFYPPLTPDSLGSFYTASGGLNGVPVVFDWPEGGIEAMAAGSDSALLVFVDLPGTSWPWLYLDDQGVSQPVIADIFPDRTGPEAVYYRPGAVVIMNFLLEESLAILPIPADLDPGDVYLALADLDRASGDDPEIVIAGKNGWVWVVKLDGDQMPGWGKRCCGAIVAPPAIADIDGDGYLDVVLTDEDYRSWVMLRSGSPLDGWPNTWYGCSLPSWSAEFYPADVTIPVPSPVLADLDCDGGADIIQGSLFECIAGWDAGGERLTGFPVTMGGGCSASAIGDINGDGMPELVTAGGDGFVYAFAHPGMQAGGCDIPWRSAYFSGRRNAVYPDSLMPDPSEPGSRLLVKGSFHAFPNPAGAAYNQNGAQFDSFVQFQFRTETGGLATIELFDITGRKVKTLHYDDIAVPKMTTVPVDISDLGSGLYICRLRLEGSSGTADEFFKLAVKR